MGRQIQIHATANDIRSLIAAVATEIPDLCRLEIDPMKREITTVPCDSDNPDHKYCITKKEAFLQVQQAIEEYNLMHHEEDSFHISLYLDQCVEIKPNFMIHSDQTISGSIFDNGGRIFVDSARTESIDQLYACFLKYTKSLSVKYKMKEQKSGFIYYTFPKADFIIKDYLMKKESNEKHCYTIKAPADFPDNYLLG